MYVTILERIVGMAAAGMTSVLITYAEGIL